jgi:hypothetical protein
MIGLIGMSDHRDRSRQQMIRIRGLRVELERLVMRDIIDLLDAVRARMRRVRIIESTLEPAPGDIFRVEQIADISARHCHSIGMMRGDIASRLRIADHRSRYTIGTERGRYQSAYSRAPRLPISSGYMQRSVSVFTATAYRRLFLSLR